MKFCATSFEDCFFSPWFFHLMNHGMLMTNHCWKKLVIRISLAMNFQLSLCQDLAQRAWPDANCGSSCGCVLARGAPSMGWLEGPLAGVKHDEAIFEWISIGKKELILIWLIWSWTEDVSTNQQRDTSIIWKNRRRGASSKGDETWRGNSGSWDSSWTGSPWGRHSNRRSWWRNGGEWEAPHQLKASKQSSAGRATDGATNANRKPSWKGTKELREWWQERSSRFDVQISFAQQIQCQCELLEWVSTPSE